MVLMNPKNKAAMTILEGLQLPKIKTAMAKNPKPATVTLNSVDVVATKMTPPMPAKKPESVTAMNLKRYILIPSESAACGFSPQALSLNPNFVYKQLPIEYQARQVRYRNLSILW